VDASTLVYFLFCLRAVHIDGLPRMDDTVRYTVRIGVSGYTSTEMHGLDGITCVCFYIFVT
jgi:hypothetical protein